ncbi:MAG: M1 family metallopeptidase, partial [Pseudomonadota bacterium]|nr:M1 family metallopeptidase [Pseudomonadota bacterium]
MSSADSSPNTAGPVAAQAITTQLPRSVVPLHYDVDLIPDAAHGRFAASAAIEIEVIAPTRAITFNAAGLAIRQARLTDAQTHRSVASSRIDTNAGQETVTVNFAHVLSPGRYRLALDYRGEIGTQAAGLFSLDYQSAHGPRRALFTQFENSDARRMIPCWDEPAYKATFTLSATVPAADLAISNMPVRTVTARAHAKKRVEFATTPKMSSYLLFFASGDLERATTRSGATELGVVTQRGLTGQAALVLDASATILQHYNEYFGVAYPLPKLDNIAAPGRSEFFGAMENWGAIFTFEHAMLLDPAISTQNDKQGVFSTAAHEMAHQWFGDLVTMQWWDDLWLNEGFASWMESRTTARLHPEWQTVVETVAGRERAMSLDALSTTHPVVQHVDTVAQASQAFDAITYQKGEAVIRM